MTVGGPRGAIGSRDRIKIGDAMSGIFDPAMPYPIQCAGPPAKATDPMDRDDRGRNGWEMRDMRDNTTQVAIVTIVG